MIKNNNFYYPVNPPKDTCPSQKCHIKKQRE